MCQIIVINRGEKQIETPKQLIEHFNLSENQIKKHLDLIEKEDIEKDDCCICDIDLDLLFADLEVKYVEIDGDYYLP